jgi:hypothetical protein
MQPALVRGLDGLRSPDGEQCSLHITDNTPPGIAVVLKRERPVLTEHRWNVDVNHSGDGDVYTYERVFETDSAAEIVGAIKRLLAMPAIAQ